MSNNKRIFNKRKFKHGALATAITAIFIAILVFINIISTMIFDRFPVAIDLTNDNVFSIGDTTIDYIENIDIPVTITILATEANFVGVNTYINQANEILKNYAKYNSNIKIDYIDMLQNPDKVSKYNNEVDAYDVVVETKNDDGSARIKIITLADLVNFPTDMQATVDQYVLSYSAYEVISSYSAYIESSKAEQSITSALMNVTDANPITVTVLTGLQESDISGFTSILNSNGYIIDTVNILKEEIPSSTNIVIIAAPTIDYSTDAINKLDAFLNNNGILGKDVLYIASVEQPKTPKLDEFLAEWGIAIGYSTICETNSNNFYNSMNFTYQFMINESYKQDISNLSLSLLAPDARPINLLWIDNGMRTAEAYVSTSNSAILKPFDAPAGWTTSDATEKGTFHSVVIGSKAVFIDNLPEYSNIAAVSSMSMFDPMLLTTDQLNNGDFLLSFMNGLTQKSPGVTILPKTIGGSAFDITEGQKNALKWTFQVIIPFSVLIVGIVVWARRRNR